MNDAVADLLLQMIGPAAGALIVVVCFGAWLLTGRRPYMLAFACATALAAFAAFLQIFPLLPVFGLNVVLSNALYTTGALAAAEAVLARSGKRIGLGWDGAIIVLMIVAIGYFFFVEPNFHARVYIQNFSSGAIFLYVAVRLRHLAGGHVGDRIMLGAMVLFAVGFFPLSIFSTMHASPLTENAFADPTYWQALQLSNTILGGTFIISVIVAALVDFIDDLQRERDTDRLTGVLNRRGFEERAEVLLGKTPVAAHTLVVCDIDHFKRVNDTYGHSAGDRLLRAFGDVLKRNAGEAVLIGRLGGEEFAVLLSGGSVSDAREFVGRLQADLAAGNYWLPPGAAPVSVSLGVAGWLEGERYETMFDRADAALYRAKTEGRDRAVFVGEIPARRPGAQGAVLST